MSDRWCILKCLVCKLYTKPLHMDGRGFTIPLEKCQCGNNTFIFIKKLNDKELSLVSIMQSTTLIH
jgi:hypothetical protein